MNDPWDVKSVRQSGQYVSCMKINGVPLLPPLLSKECRKEMKYYKLLALEVQKRMSVLQPYMCDASSSSDYEDSTDAPDIPECEEDVRSVSPGSLKPYRSPKHGTSMKKICSPKSHSPKFYIDLNVNINNKDICNTVKKVTEVCSSPIKDEPERDHNCINKISHNVTEKQIITKVGTKINVKKKNVETDVSTSEDDPPSDSVSGVPLLQDGPASISSKSFTGSLNDIYSDSIKDSQIESGRLVRQSSYTLLKPSPALLAHLEVHSQATGVDMASISMSESISNLSTTNKRRRNWDLETAKRKWSNMALELNQKERVTRNVKPVPRRPAQPRSKSVVPSSPKRNSLPNTRGTPKSELVKNSSAPKTTTNKVIKSDPPSPTANKVYSLQKLNTPKKESEDPAVKVRELYEKMQKQQLIQMANLIEKQKREQLLLQQVFEEQNNLLFKQLKTICPKSPIEAKEAWGDQLCESNRGPVSLSQVINYKSPEQSHFGSPETSTLTNTNKYINHCDNILKKSRDITSTLKKQPSNCFNNTSTKVSSPQTVADGSITRTHSPIQRNHSISRRLNYETSASTDHDNDQILTDRTNDTLADLNVTFPSDHSDESNASVISKNINQYNKEPITHQVNEIYKKPSLNSTSTDIALKKIERAISNSINNSLVRLPKRPVFNNTPTDRERAAATTIVAHVKGYLVRRLMRTDRVQGIVQTIKDALLCALQLHQEREGIRGADVDLHRRLIQQITAACYSLHDTFVASTAADRCAMIAADRDKRKRTLSIKSTSSYSYKQTDIMSQSHSGSFPARAKRPPPSPMTQSNYETFSGDKSSPVSRRYMPSPRRRPWR